MRPLHAIGLKISSVLVFILMATLLKATDGRIPPGELVFFRSLFAVPVIVVWLAWRHELHSGFRTRDPMGHLWRGLIGTVSMGASFAALLFLPLPDATAIGYAAPLLVVIFASMFLGEQVRAYRLIAVGLGMVGVLIILGPRLSFSGAADPTQSLGALFALIAATFAALAQVLVRKLVQSETTSAIVFWFSINATLLSLVTLPWGWVIPNPVDALLLVTAGLAGGLAQVLLTSSYRHGDVSLVAPFEYASMIFALAIGYWIFGETPTLLMLGGAALVISSGVLIIWRERQLGLERQRQKKASSL